MNFHRTICLIGTLLLPAVILAASLPPDAKHMNAIPELSGPPDAVDWAALPRLGVEPVTVFNAEENVAGYNMHPAATYFAGRWWVMWSSGAWGEDMPGQRVRFAHSANGTQWSVAKVLAEPDTDHMLTPTGFWVREGSLYAMAVHRRGKPVVDGKRQKVEGKLDFTLRIFRLDPANESWALVEKLPNTFNDKPVEPLSTGGWAMIRSTLESKRFYGVGGIAGLADWEYFPIPEAADAHAMTEGHVYELRDGKLALLFRDNRRSNRIYRAFSEDRGHTWTNPIPTDFPDQTAKFSVLRLSSGPYLLVSNPRHAEERFPLTVSFSDDGIVFDRIATVIADLPAARFPNFTKRPGAQYPHAIEAAGSVLIAYSVNQESIQIVMVPRDRLARGQAIR